MHLRASPYDCCRTQDRFNDLVGQVLGLQLNTGFGGQDVLLHGRARLPHLGIGVLARLAQSGFAFLHPAPVVPLLAQAHLRPRFPNPLPTLPSPTLSYANLAPTPLDGATRPCLTL